MPDFVSRGVICTIENIRFSAGSVVVQYEFVITYPDETTTPEVITPCTADVVYMCSSFTQLVMVNIAKQHIA